MADTTKSRAVLILRAVLNCALVVVFFGIPLFVPAGTLGFWNAWLFLGLFDASFLTILVYLIFRDPEYAEKRFRGNETEKPQRVVMSPARGLSDRLLHRCRDSTIGFTGQRIPPRSFCSHLLCSWLPSSCFSW